MGLEDMAEDLNDPAVKARLDAFVKNRHYRMDTYRIQDACANCRHVFVRQEHDNDDELYCTFRAPERPPCMSVFMDEFKSDLTQPLGADAESHEKWEAWKTGRRVVPQAICGEWAPKPNAETQAAMSEADEIVKAHRARFDTAADLIGRLEKEDSGNPQLRKRSFAAVLASMPNVGEESDFARAQDVTGDCEPNWPTGKDGTGETG